MVLLQLKDPLELIVKRMELIPGSWFLSHCDMTKWLVGLICEFRVVCVGLICECRVVWDFNICYSLHPFPPNQINWECLGNHRAERDIIYYRSIIFHVYIYTLYFKVSIIYLFKHSFILQLVQNDTIFLIFANHFCLI